MAKYKNKIESLYKQEQETKDSCSSKLQFLSESIFDFTTYDSDMDEFLATCMLEVIRCILDGKTFEYQGKEEDYLNFILMVNMPFLKNKIDWGTSIRGAWFINYPEGQTSFRITNELIVPARDIKKFMKELLVWANN